MAACLMYRYRGLAVLVRSYWSTAHAGQRGVMDIVAVPTGVTITAVLLNPEPRESLAVGTEYRYWQHAGGHGLRH